MRRALPAEAPKLSQVAFAAKASWGYSQAFMDACRKLLTIEPDAVSRDIVIALIEAGEVIGFYRIAGPPPDAMLMDFWILPAHQGRGNGRRLFDHAVDSARAGGFSRLVIESDPNAAGFYRSMGARLTGETASPLSLERMLPVFEFRL